MEAMIKSAASAASPEYVKFQAVVKSAASAASLCAGRARTDLISVFFSQCLGALAPPKNGLKKSGRIDEQLPFLYVFLYKVRAAVDSV